MAPESNEVNWKHVKGTFIRWQQIVRKCNSQVQAAPESHSRALLICTFLAVFMNMCQQITGALFSAFLPTFLSENGFEGANAQIATLAPYGSAAVVSSLFYPVSSKARWLIPRRKCMIIASMISDRYRNRGWPTQFGWWLSIIAFGIYLGAPYTNRSARIAALILGETGHYSELSSILSA